MMFCELTRAGGATRPDRRKRNLAQQTWYVAAGERSRWVTLNNASDYNGQYRTPNPNRIPSPLVR